MEATGLVLGSGLGVLAERIEGAERVGFAEAGLPASTVPGHEGEFVLGSLGGAPVVAMRGRVHLYEGHDGVAVAAGVRWMAGRGVKRLILTNAAGCVNPDFGVGEWMLIRDQLNLTGASPLRGPEFVDMSGAYDADWAARARERAAARGLRLHEGVYAGLRGPQYETPAEVRMLRALGADAVGMSTVLEAIQARALGLELLGLSCLTNWAAGMPAASLEHEEVIEVGRRAAESVTGLVEELVGGS